MLLKWLDENVFLDAKFSCLISTWTVFFSIMFSVNCFANCACHSNSMCRYCPNPSFTVKCAPFSGSYSEESVGLKPFHNSVYHPLPENSYRSKSMWTSSSAPIIYNVLSLVLKNRNVFPVSIAEQLCFISLRKKTIFLTCFCHFHVMILLVNDYSLKSYH